MIYSIEVSYPNGKHLPSNSDHSFLSILPVHLRRLRKIPLTDTINKIFDGKVEEVFGKNSHIVHGDPAEVILTATRRL